MPWDTSRRRKDPPHWHKLREIVLARSLGLCEHTETKDSPYGSTTTRCTYPAHDIDHIVNLANGGTDELSNLQALCVWHHKRKTQREAAEARGPRPTERRPKPKHPGLLD